MAPALLLLLLLCHALADSGVFLRFYDGQSVDDFKDISSDDFGRLADGLPPRKTTVIYAHGFGETLQRESARAMAEVFLQRGEENFLALGYMEDPLDLGEAVSRVPQWTEELSRAVLSLQKGVHLVGYSLGATVMAQVGKVLSGRQVLVSRITGLDPAGNVVPVELALSPDYAEMVDVIHTDAGSFGFARPCGSVHFFPNVGVASQPGCFEEEELVKVENLSQFLAQSFAASPQGVPTLSLCSHQRSWRYFAESVLRPRSFLATKKFGRPGCRAEGDVHAFMGLATPPTATGCYFLDTRPKCPFGGGNDDEELATLCGDHPVSQIISKQHPRTFP